ncbi:RAN binding protein 1 [Actinidia rufa]|uniref:RAN binding protein 1 n=1 Tax=Actinidia rufa TaxID=165716 RepID=A0A7J0GRA9_9ERIC|nr:RAN binding protein 1 [Actinidia rufa]
MASTDPDRREDEEATTATDDEDTGAPVAPIIKLEEVAVTTGEEDEDAILDLKSKLYRFDKEGNQWKERGAGTVKLLKHKETGKVRLVMRQSKTLKICANHLGPYFPSIIADFYFIFTSVLPFDGKIRCVRACDFAVLSTMSVQEYAGNDKACIWHAADFSDGELKDELFCIRFGSIDSK